MAEIKRFPIMRHLRSEPSQQILRFRRGRMVQSGRGLAFWFHPLSASIAEVPADDRELPFLFHGRSRDFQDTVVQGVVSYRVTDAEKLANRVDFTLDLQTGVHRHKPLEKLAGLLTELSQQFALDYLVHTDLNAILEDGVEAIHRSPIAEPRRGMRGRMAMRSTNEVERLSGFMLGTMIGDAIGLPFEGVRRRRVAALLRSKPLRHRLLFRYGFVSDDTEHMLMTVIAWQRSSGDVSVFARRLAWQLRLWMLSVPPATGLATAKACIKLLLGIPPHRSGVRSAGNGPAMRAGVLGLLCRSDDELRDFSLAAARITHRDERAEHGALAVAIAARASAESTDHAAMLEAFGVALDRLLPEGQMRAAIDDARASVERGESTEAYADALGCARGVTGFVMHTVPVVLHLWMCDPADYREGLERIIRLGGDWTRAAQWHAVTACTIATKPPGPPRSRLLEAT